MNATFNPLNQLATKEQQAIWLDFLSREFLESGGLSQRIAEDSLTGVTSNPAIFEAAMRSVVYDDALHTRLNQADADPVALYEHLAIEDIQKAADILHPVYQRQNSKDGYVSLEVSPYLAYDTAGTLAEARRLWQAVNRPNLMIKVPGTPAGVPAIAQLIAEGINVNITLLFSIQAYQDVVNAYINGLNARLEAGKAIDRVASVASFFVSRIDTRMDQRIDDALKQPDAQTAALKALQGKVAIANAKLAYQHYLEIFTAHSGRWHTLAQQGAQPQRLLWASTGTKNPHYPATLYVDELIGPNTVNTMPQATLEAFRQTGKVAQTLTENLPQAQHVLEEVRRFWLDLDGVTQELSEAGAKAFCDAADTLLGTIATKRLAYLGDRINPITYHLPTPLTQAVDQTLERARQDGWTRRLWQGDPTLWTNHHEDQWLGWLAAGQGQASDTPSAQVCGLNDVHSQSLPLLPAIDLIAQTLASESYTHAVLLGMGGSSLGPEVLAQTLGKTGKGLTVHVLDSTNPDEINAAAHAVTRSDNINAAAHTSTHSDKINDVTHVSTHSEKINDVTHVSTHSDKVNTVAQAIDLRHTLFIVSSKSGSTLEPELLCAHFYAAVQKIYTADKEARDPTPDVLKRVGQHFIAITDPGSNLEKLAKANHYRAIFSGNPEIGGRYSVLSAFGMVPLGIMGHDVAGFLKTTQSMVHACAASAPPAVNPGVRLGIVLGTAARLGHNKLTFITSPSVASVGAWLEQLIAESTGKNGKGIIPVDLEPLGNPDVYGPDRVFVSLQCATDTAAACEENQQKLQALVNRGHPVISITLPRPDTIGQEFFRWQIATAIAGICLDINPFDQPDVEASKVKTRLALKSAQEKKEMELKSLLVQEGDLSCYGPAEYLTAPGATLQDIIKTHLARLSPAEGCYAAILAYIARTPSYEQQLIALRTMIRDNYRVATVGGFGPRFLHSTGQAYKGGPNQGVFLQITADPCQDLPAPTTQAHSGETSHAHTSQAHSEATSHAHTSQAHSETTSYAHTSHAHSEATSHAHTSHPHSWATSHAPTDSVSFGTVQAAQALGDLQVLAERGRRYLHIHIKGGHKHDHDAIERGLRQLTHLVEQALN